ncbi:DUF554 domain-containing protein [Holdemania massiliensis]|uniref:DUF554 domain-containing protein n=1 Tax=Holdemania massiliensis TaxID=1468449 RepID=UPI001F054274|nr:DUF554 domain-containing protein [Holdemania massiliensis]MCH1942737.1 DUF554 domain-containing protein [Holdemania massiliensis]
MPGIGTLINAAAVIGGGVLGLIFRKGLPQRFQDTLMQALGLSTIFIGIAGTLEKMLILHGETVSAEGTMLAVLSLAAGALLGEGINLEKRFEQLGQWLKKKTGSVQDTCFLEGFITASLTICIGAMAIVGALQDGLSADPSLLITKAVLDFLIIMIFTSALGKGAIFSVIPLVLFQGSITLLAQFIAPLLSEPMIANIAMIGSMLIFCVGVNLMFNTKINVANLLPALIIAAILTPWF